MPFERGVSIVLPITQGGIPMNTIRMIAIALPMMLLLACGGGGSGGATATRTPTPMTPPHANLETLPSFLAPQDSQDLDTLRTRFSGTAPTITDETRIVPGVQVTATLADMITMQNIVIPGISGITGTPITPDCSSNTSCTASIPDVDMITFSLTDIEDLSLIDGTNLERFDSETRAIMDVGEVKVIESRSAGLDSDGTRLAFQTYGGWLDNSVFGHRRIEVTEGSNTAVYFASYSFGKASGSNPRARSSETSAMWTGVVVGVERNDQNAIQGTTTINIGDLSNPNVNVSISFRDLVGAGNGDINWRNVSLTNGTFSNTNGFEHIEGSFYGDNHEEVGGIFRTTDLYGAFGATRQ